MGFCRGLGRLVLHFVTPQVGTLSVLESHQTLCWIVSKPSTLDNPSLESFTHKLQDKLRHRAHYYDWRSTEHRHIIRPEWWSVHTPRPHRCAILRIVSLVWQLTPTLRHNRRSRHYRPLCISHCPGLCHTSSGRFPCRRQSKSAVGLWRLGVSGQRTEIDDTRKLNLDV